MKLLGWKTNLGAKFSKKIPSFLKNGLSGIGDLLVKEEWRGDIIGNLFYPTSEGPHKAILHINGSVPLIQDARSIMLAREGYIVLEIGYNLPQHGQENLFLRKTAQPLEYFEAAINKLLQHPKSYGDRVAIVGQSKGSDLDAVF